MTCLPWDILCIFGEMIAPALQALWIFIQLMAYIFGAAIAYKFSRLIYKGRYVEANLIIALVSGYLCFTIASWLALAGVLAAIAVVLLAIFTPVGGIIVTWLLSKMGSK